MSNVKTEWYCPKCSRKLYLENEHQVNLSNPPSVWVYCKNCDYRGVRNI